MTIPELLRRAAELHGSLPAVVADGDVTLTFAELRDQSRRLAGWLHEHGVEPGQRVAVMLPNTIWWPLTWLACAELGAIVVAVNAQCREQDLKHLLVDSGAVVLVTAEGATATADVRLLTIPQELPPLRPLPVCDINAESVLSVQYTSGTSGPPKGCVLTHRYWIGIAQQAIGHDPGLRADDVLLTAQPYSYIDPQWQLVTTLLLGCTLVLLDGFHPSTFLSSVARHQVTVFYCLGAMPALLLTQDLSLPHRLRFVLCSGIPPASHRELEERIGVPWYELYGSTELGGAAVAVSASDHDATVGVGTLGRPLPGFEVRIDRGELVVRSPNFMTGYWQGDGSVVDPRFDGWFSTGDLVSERDGLLFFLGRSKDVIRRAGENISAAEVESVIETCPGVQLSAVIAAHDPIRGEEAHAVVMGVGLEPEALADYCLERIARFKVPRFWTFCDLPLTPSGKVAKDALRRLVTADSIARYDRTSRSWHTGQDT